MIFRSKTALSLLAAGSMAGTAFAGSPTLTEAAAPEPAGSSSPHLSAYDRIWSAFTLYKNDDNPVLQEFSLQGRIQLQFAMGDADQGNYGSDDRPDEVLWGDDIEVRRWRLGFKSKWFRKWKLDGQIDINPDWDPFYRQIYDLNLTYNYSDAINIGFGKYKANNFGIEQFTSSKEILTMERGLLSNQLFTGELTGARFNGKSGNWVYALGVYSGDIEQEFNLFENGIVYQASVGYDFYEALGTEKALVKLDYQYSDGPSNGLDDTGARVTNGGLYSSAFSLNSHIEQGRWGLYTDLLSASGRGTTGDVWGVIIMPSYYLTDGLQLVARYQYANGDNDGLRLQSRYERLAPSLTDGGRGENYHAFYLGLNYYLYGHKLKLMGGAEYHTMDNGNDAGGEFDGVTGIVGMRMSF
jgi:phosphate-selective porin OprO/OprP